MARPSRRRILLGSGLVLLLALVGGLVYAERQGWLTRGYWAAASSDLSGCGEVEWTSTPDAGSAPDLALETVHDGAERLTSIALHPDGETTYLLQETGEVLATDGTGLTEVLDLSGRTTIERDQGLLGGVVDHDGAWLYLVLTGLEGETRVEAFPLDDGDVLDEPVLLLAVDQDDEHHNGGGIDLDAQGHLYVGIGDGGLIGDQDGNAQASDELLGKILRITPTPGGATPYEIPDGNPFVDDPDGHPEIFATGVRNPFRLHVDAGTLWVGDVGHNCVEEISAVGADEGGANLGWNRYEGTRTFVSGGVDDHHEPTFQYPHEAGWCATIGGVPYRGDAIEALEGRIVAGDFCSPTLLSFAPDGSDAADLGLDLGPTVVQILPDHDGELLVVSHSGSVRRLIEAP